MQSNAIEDKGADARGAVRASLYLAATLFCDGSSAPVKIRNISSSGALVEGAVIPEVSTLVQLVRGGLIVHGLVVRSGAGKCGLKFSGSIDIQQWRSCPANAEQQRVDEIVRLVKAGVVPLPVPPLASDVSAAEAEADLSDHLRQAVDLLTGLGTALGDDMEVVMRHAAALQKLDIAVQIISTVQGVIADADGEVDAAKLAGLRRSAEQAIRS